MTWLVEDPIIALLFFGIAVVYSSAGFGGGSSYLAVLSVFSPSQEIIRPIAYFCNIAVTGFSTTRYRRRGWLNLADAKPFLYGSIPFAFVGGMFRVDDGIYLILLAIALTIAGLLILVKGSLKESPRAMVVLDSFLGRFILSGVIGFVSGMVGIGGGIFLAPVLHLANWRSPERIAAISSIFILVNAVVGATGFFIANPISFDWTAMAILVVCVVLGTILGLRFNVTPTGRRWIRRVTGLLLLVVALRIFLDQW